jgi:GAF domain-containing protein
MEEERAGSAANRGQPSTHSTRTGPDPDDLSQRLADMARDMQRQADSPAVMDIIVAAAVGTVPGAEEASISLAERGRRVVSSAATGDVPRRFDEVQTETRQGPCVDAMYEHATIRVDHLAHDDRWPELARRAGEIGVASMLCFQLFVEGDDLGALTLLARRPGAFTDESERIGLLLASHAAVAVAQAQKLTHLSTALANRDIIGQAKGVLMERYKITSDQAFALLAKVSQDTNSKLHEVAETLTHTGVLAADRERGRSAASRSREAQKSRDAGR